MAEAAVVPGSGQSSNEPGPADTLDQPSEVLDPRVQIELEKLNKASNEINRLELQLDEARAGFRQMLTESTQKLNILSKNLGQCIEKARPYYEARMKAKEAQLDTQTAALRFEKACSQQAAAKEMVNLAEQGFFKRGQAFDPAWQEMLNHATIKVNEAEQERLESEIEHKRIAKIFSDAEQKVKRLQKDLKRTINKSKLYFETKAHYNHCMEEQKKIVGILEKSVIKSKQVYSEALKSLETISDEIHQQRREAKARKELGWRRPGVGAESPSPPPEMNTITETDSSQNTDKIKVTDSAADKNETECDVKNIIHVRDKDKLPTADTDLLNTKKQRFSDPYLPCGEEMRKQLTERRLSREGAIKKTDKKIKPHTVPIVSVSDDVEDRTVSPPSEADQTRTNAEIMDNIQKAKDKRTWLHPRSSSEDLLDDISDTDSITESITSATMLDDQQIENLMMEPADYASMLESETAEIKKSQKITYRHSLPPKLSYLENYVHFRPEFNTTSDKTDDSDSIVKQLSDSARDLTVIEDKSQRSEVKTSETQSQSSEVNNMQTESQSADTRNKTVSEQKDTEVINLEFQNQDMSKVERPRGNGAEADDLNTSDLDPNSSDLDPSQTGQQVVVHHHQEMEETRAKVGFSSRKGFSLSLQPDEVLEYFV